MELNHDYENVCEHYLLGELSESDQLQLEEAYFSDDSLFERFLAVKDELIDAYTRGELSGQKLERFQHHFLSSGPRRQRVEDARELVRAVSAASLSTATAQTTATELQKNAWVPPRQWFAKHLFPRTLVLRVGFAALLLGVVAGCWIVVRQLQDRDARRSSGEAARTNPPGAFEATRSPAHSASINIGGERAASNSSPAPVPETKIAAKPSPRAPAAQIAFLVLLPVSSRDIGTSNSLTLRPEVRAVQLRLVFNGEPYDNFEVLVRTVDGRQVVRRSVRKAHANGSGKSVTIIVDSSLLRRQDYIATLSGRTRNGKLETIGDYYFRIESTTTQLGPSH